MRNAAIPAIARPKSRNNDLSACSPIHLAFAFGESFSPQNPDIGMRGQIIDVPAYRFFFFEMPGNALFHIPFGAAGVNISSRLEPAFAQSAYFDRQIFGYQQNKLISLKSGHD